MNAPILTASHYGVVHFGDLECEAVVLKGGERGYVRRQLAKLLGFHEGHKGGRFARFLTDFAPNSLSELEKTREPILLPSGRQTQFFPAGIIADLASAVVNAALTGTLHKARKGIVPNCMKIMHALATTGEVALIDEATGYQFHRAPDALQDLIAKLLRQSSGSWERRFHADYYRAIYRLFGWKYQGHAQNPPHVLGQITQRWVYGPVHADSGPVVLKRRFNAAWGKTEVFVANATAWELTRVRSWNHHENWSIRFAVAHTASYGLRLEGASRHHYGDLRQHRRRLLFPYGDMHQVRVGYLTLYSDLGSCRRSMRFPYWLTQQAAVRHVLGYDITNVNPITKRLTASWSLLSDARLQAVVNSPEMAWNGRTIRIVEATLSCDEESPVWIAQVEIAELADFAAIGIGDTITLALGLEAFVLVVDGKTLSRESVAERRCELSAVSPVALLDSPFAGTIRFYQPIAESAEAAVESLIGPVTWQLPNWIIPAGRLMLEGVTPLAAARNIVAAIGGIVESNPDGTVVCRRRHPVSIPQYSAATVAHSLFDADVISTRSQIAPSRGFNRVTIANEDGAAGSSSDRIEFVADADDDNRGTVRAYLVTTRPVVLTHTGHAATVIASLGAVSRSETETVEFVEGRASTRYPVTIITSAVWQHTDLGAVSADGQSLVAATAGFSLLRVTYTVTSLNWRVALSIDEEVQFVLVDQ